MDAKDVKAGFAVPWAQGALLAALLGFGALFLNEAPYQSARQAGDTLRDEAHFDAQDVSARLWQDPLGVVQRERERSASQATTGSRRAEALANQIQERGGKEGRDVAVVAVLLRGGPHAELVEHRRRTRYAVLAGASVMSFVPVDAEHLGWVAMSQPGLPDALPYEWLEVMPERAAQRGAPRHLLLLWLDDRAFGSQPVQKMAALQQSLDGSNAANAWRVIGPGRSDQVAAMLAEARAASAPAAGTPKLRYYAATATVSDRTLLRSEAPPADALKLNCAVGNELERRLGIGFTRTIASDDQAADALIRELWRRGLRPEKLSKREGEEDEDAQQRLCRAEPGSREAPSHVAVIAEWDTLYGRSLRRPFRADPERPGYCVENFSYLRGLDGLLPADKPEGDDNKRGDAKADAERRRDGSLLERAEGQSQFDYLRRLAQQVRERDAELRRTTRDGSGLRAIGVMGSDLHDKLLVLQALAPDMPDTLFFTTDLDARYLHPREQGWTRNLLVGSSFGLRLDDGLQSGTPPFRASYQTATFFAMRLLLDDARRAAAETSSASMRRGGACLHEASAAWDPEQLQHWLAKPRLFEIGRTAAFDFTGREAAQRQVGCRGNGWLTQGDCADIHPPGSPRHPEPGWAGRWFVCFVLLLAWLPVSYTWARDGRLWLKGLGLPSPPGPRRWRPVRLFTWLALQVVVGPLALAAVWPGLADRITKDGKPLVWAEGISTWPTEYIRIVVVVIGIYMLLRGWRGLERSQRALTRRFKLGLARCQLIKRMKEPADAKPPRLPLGDCIVNLFTWGELRPPLRHDPASGMVLAAERLWQRHVVQNRIVARLLRTAAAVVLALLLTGALLHAFHGFAPAPERGRLSVNVHHAVLFFVVLVVYGVLFFVVDATLLCVSFLRKLRLEGTVWPEPTIAHYERKLGFRDAELVGHWIDLEFLGRRTRDVNELIYHPFVLLSLVLLSRSPAFDDWTMPLVGKVLAAIGALLALACPVMLRLTAEKSRRTALYHVDAALLRANAAGTAKRESMPGFAAPTAKQIELLRSHIADMDRGALAPYTQQPLLKAVLLPFATIGGSQLLEYLRLASL